MLSKKGLIRISLANQSLEDAKRGKNPKGKRLRIRVSLVIQTQRRKTSDSILFGLTVL